jgi:ribose transport system permease protein
MKKELGLFILLIVLCLTVVGVELGQQLSEGTTISQLRLPRFLTTANLSNLATSIGLFGVFSIGLGMVIITGGIDLSVGSTFAWCGVLLSMALTEWNWAWPLAALFVIALPMAMGWAHGTLITRVRIQPFIVTLCALLIYRGLARYSANENTKGFGSSEGFGALKFLASGRLGQWLDPTTGKEVFVGIPMPFIILVLTAIVMWFVLHRSTYGRYLLAVGRNEEATRFSGINTRLVITSSYVLAGMLTGISGILFAFYTNSVAPSNHGNFYEAYGIAAAVLGGCSLRGGEGSIIGILIGTALLQVLQNLVNLLGIKSALNFPVMGAVVLLGVVADQYFKVRAEKKLARLG